MPPLFSNINFHVRKVTNVLYMRAMHKTNILDIPRAWVMVPSIVLKGFWHVSFYRLAWVICFDNIDCATNLSLLIFVSL
jgi:hypothetical protein